MLPNLAICCLFPEEPDDSVHIFTGHTGEVYTVACSPMNASLVATGGGDDKGFLWRIGHGDWAFELQGHGDSICCLAFSTDGRLLACGCLGGLIKSWEILSQNLKFSLDGPGEGIEWIRWHPRGHLVLAGSEDSIVWMWNADKGACLNTFSGHGGSVTCGDFTPDGKVVCTGSDDATLRIWDPKSGKNIHVVGGKVVVKSCAKYLHQQVHKIDAYAAGDIGTSVKNNFFRLELERLKGTKMLNNESPPLPPQLDADVLKLFYPMPKCTLLSNALKYFNP